MVGVQPFGGSGLSGTGPKAGGPLYLRRLVSDPPAAAPEIGWNGGSPPPVAHAYVAWLRRTGRADVADRVATCLSRSRLGVEAALPGPVGERNLYTLHPRGRVAAVAATDTGLLFQLGAILATGNAALIIEGAPSGRLSELPPDIAAKVAYARNIREAPEIRLVLHEGAAEDLAAIERSLSERDGPIVAVKSVSAASTGGSADLDPIDLLEERALSINTAAAGGNASLMSIG